MTDRLDISILDHINPGALTYQEWLSVGMALKDEGYTASVWDAWSQRDPERYKPGECYRKWDTFEGSANPVTAGTIVALAKRQGWTPAGTDPGHALEWDATIGGDELRIVDPNWVETEEVHEPTDDEWDPVHELVTYLETLFDAEDHVGYVTTSWYNEEQERHLPTKGNWDRTAGQLIEQLGQCNGDIGAVLGDYKPEVGAWIRFNPLDGQGVKNANVTEFRYALVESDETAIDKQHAILQQLELPIAALVHSGGKSLHAIVRIDAANYEEYRRRVDYLYDVCKKNGLSIDSQNRNPSRLSRMPGVRRNGRKQYLVATNIGKASWAEWHDWIESVNDDLPEPESLATVWDNLPDLAPPLIDGVLRQGHKMLIAGPSKAGKSYALIQLCAALAEGRNWMGWPCAQGSVLYVNLELDRASALHRFRDVYRALGWEPTNIGHIDIWNLRGKAVPMDKLAPKLIRRAARRDYIAIIIDPIYKVITGDENSADQMAKFTNQFDLIAAELGCAVIYCHHHSKGHQGAKRSMDRASGSGVFARDPDALLDMIELELTPEIIGQQENEAICTVAKWHLNRHVPDFEDEVSQDDLCSMKGAIDACRRLLTEAQFKAFDDDCIKVVKAVGQQTAWRIEGTLREFATFPPRDVWFRYPIHRIDSGVLKNAQPEGEQPPWKRGTEKNKKRSSDRKKERKEAIETAFEACGIDEDVTVTDLAEFLGVSEKTARRHIREHGGFQIEEGIVTRKGGTKP